MTNLFRHLFGKYFARKSAPIHRQRGLMVEALEDRFCPAAVDYLPASHTLLIVGDARDDVIQVEATRPHEIKVITDGTNVETFSRVDHVVIQTGRGNDTVDLKYSRVAAVDSFHIDTGAGNDIVRMTETITADPPGEADPPTESDPPGDRDPLESQGLIIVVHTGAGDDEVGIHFTRPADTRLPAEFVPAEFHIDTGAGHDVVDFEAVQGLPLIRSIDIDTGAGHDVVGVQVGDPTGLADPPDPDMPTDQMPTDQMPGFLLPAVRIAAGAGDDLVDVNLAGHPDLMRIDLGAGNDLLRVQVGDPTGLAEPPDPDMPTDQRPSAIFIDAGAGNDVVDYKVAEFRGLHDINLGAGNDRLSVTVGDPTGLLVNNEMPTDQLPVVRINAGAGNDVVNVRIPHTRALIDIDMGPGKDMLDIQVGDPTGIDGTRG